MFCIDCGAELPDTAKYCMECGVPQNGGESGNRLGEVRYETCEIVHEMIKDTNMFGFGTPVFQFWAKAVGPNGVYDVGEKTEFKGFLHPGNPNAAAETAHNLLVNQLTSEGWEATESRGPAWYNWRFRRRVK